MGINSWTLRWKVKKNICNYYNITWFCSAILFSVTLGSYNLDKNDTNYMELSTDIYAVHPEYNSQTLENDIGLIKFRMAIGFTSKFIENHFKVGLKYRVFTNNW